MRKNKRQGTPFFGCIAYPLCSFTEDVQPILADLMREREKQELAQQLGVNFGTVLELRDEVYELKRQLSHEKMMRELADASLKLYQMSPRSGGGNTEEISRRIRQAIAAVHPDRWDNAPAAEEAVKQLNDLREFVLGK